MGGMNFLGWFRILLSKVGAFLLRQLRGCHESSVSAVGVGQDLSFLDRFGAFMVVSKHRPMALHGFVPQG